MRLDEAVKLSDRIRAMTNEILDAITDAIEDEAPAVASSTPEEPPPPGGRLGTFGRFKVRLDKGDPAAVEIDRILKVHGWVVARGGGRCISCIETLERTFRLDGGVSLDRALWILTGAWGHRRDTVDGRLIEGVAWLVNEDSTIGNEQLRAHLARGWTAAVLLELTNVRKQRGLDYGLTTKRSMAYVAEILAESLRRGGG